MNTKDNQEAQDEVFDYDEIYEKAKASYMRHSTSIRGQTMTQQDDPEWHIANEAWQARATLATPKVNVEVAFSDADLAMFQDNAERYNLTTPSPSNVLVEALREIHSKAQSHPDYTGGTEGKETLIDEINILAVQCLNALYTSDKATYSASTDSVSISRSEYEALKLDAKRWRKGIEDKEFGVYHNGEYMHVSRADGTIIFGETREELMDKTIAHDEAIDTARKSS